MKKILLSSVLVLSLSSAYAEDLKNSLLTKDQKDTPSVNLDNLNVATTQNKRADDTVVATINGEPLTKAVADKFLALASKGKVTNMDTLPTEQQKALITGVAASLVVEQRAKKEISEEIKNKLAASYWAREEMSKISTSEKDQKAFYEKNKEAFKGQDGKILPFDKVQQYVDMQLKQQQFNKNLMKDAKVIIK